MRFLQTQSAKKDKAEKTKSVRMKGHGVVNVEPTQEDRWRDVQRSVSDEGEQEETQRYDDLWEDAIRRDRTKGKAGSTNEWIRLLSPQSVIIEAKKKKKKEPDAILCDTCKDCH